MDLENQGASEVFTKRSFQASTGELTHAQLTRQEAKQRIQTALSHMCHEKRAMKTGSKIDKQVATETERRQQGVSGPSAPSLSTDRAWTPQQVEHVRQSTRQFLSASEAKLQCLVDCLQESSPAPVVIGAFLCSCQVSYLWDLRNGTMMTEPTPLMNSVAATL